MEEDLHYPHAPTELSSRAEVWFLKDIMFGSPRDQRRLKIITQNFNGPCSFIAVCNILILRGQIEILPPERTSVSYELLSQLVGEYLLSSSADIDISAALSIMPKTQKGMDLNPLFTGPTSFRPAGDGGELQLFKSVGIKLVHGWLVDPHSPEAEVVTRVEDYDNAVNLIVEADHACQGQFLVRDDAVVFENTPGPSNAAAGSSSSTSRTDEDKTKIEDAIVVRRFLDNTRSQLTYHGLFQLPSVVEPGSLVALFRSSHLSVLHRTTGDDSAMYTLVTDHVFLNEPTVVWERLEDVDGGSATFVDSNFEQSSPIGGDFAGHTTDTMMYHEGGGGIIDPADHALAAQLQDEEDRLASEHIARRQLEREQTRRKEEAQANLNTRRKKANEEREKDPSKKKKKDCIIM